MVAVAQSLLEQGVTGLQAYVCENLGSPDERVTQGSLHEISKELFGPLNVMILIRPSGLTEPPSKAGRRSETPMNFSTVASEEGLLTPKEVRSLALAELSLCSSSTMWM